MLETVVLFERITKVEQQRRILTTEDKLNLLTQQNAKSSKGFFTTKSSLIPLKDWHFPCRDQVEIEYSKRLIDIIIDDLTPAYLDHATNYYWYEQCLRFLLKYSEQDITQNHIARYIKKLKECKNNSLKTELLRKFQILNPCVSNSLSLAKDLQNNQLWSGAIQEYQWLLLQDYKCTSEDFFDFSECLIFRNSQYDGECTDAQMALSILINISSNQQRHESLIDQAVTLILPKDIIIKRGTDTHLFSDIGRGLNHFGKSLGGTLGGRESEIPYSECIIASAPTLLKNDEIAQNLDNDRKLQYSFDQIFSDIGVKVPIGVASASYSVGLLWNYSQIDMTVLNALTFASKGQPEQFATLQEIAGTTLESVGTMIRLSGYVAEQQVAYNLIQQGHTVEFPDTANQVGFDLLVDGQAMQVKNTLSSDYVLQHIEKNPDIPVIVNQELAESLGEHPSVFIDSGLSHAHVNQTMIESLEHIDQFDSIADFLPIPFMTLGLAAYRNYNDFGSRQIDSRQYFENIGKETVAIAGGAIAGKVILGTIGGIVAGPVGIALAGGLGAYIGGVAGSTGANMLNREKLCDQRDRVVSLLIEFAEWFNIVLLHYRVKQNLLYFQKIKGELTETQQSLSLSMTFIAYQFEVYLHAHYLEQWIEAKLKGNQSEQVQAGWVALQQSEYFLSTELRRKVAEINQALKKYKQILNPESVN